MKRSANKKRTARKTPRRRQNDKSPWMSRLTLKPIMLVILWLASFTGIAYGLHRLEPYARAANGNGEWQLKWIDVPATLDKWTLGEIEQETDLYDLEPIFESDVYSPDLCKRLLDALEKSPWIADVHRVSKQADGVVEVRADIREYLTFVVRNRMGHLVDKTGVRLPRTDQENFLSQYEDMIVVEGVRAPVPPIGQPWESPAVAGGLKLVKFLNARCPTGLIDSFKAVDVSNYNDRLNSRDGWLRIRTIHPGSYILWGLPPGEEDGIECLAERKLEMLWSLYSRDGQLPGHGIIDLRAENEILYRAAP